MQLDIAAVSRYALQPSVKLQFHAGLFIAELDDDTVTTLQLVFNLECLVILRRRQCDNSSVCQLLNALVDFHLVKHPQPEVANLYVILHRVHRSYVFKSSRLNSSL